MACLILKVSFTLLFVKLLQKIESLQMLIEKQLENGFKYLEIKNAHAEAKIALQGAHIFHFKPLGKEPILWLSKLANFKRGKAIRGGIPICFPWFGKHKSDSSLAQHGFARTAIWKLVLSEELENGTTHIALELTSNLETKKMWNYDFTLRLDITIGEKLEIAMTVTNKDDKAFEISTALHSYFNISDIENIVIEGVEGCRYFDALTNTEELQKGKLSFTEETDRVYFNTSKNINLVDTFCTIKLEQKGSNSLIIWNPWSEKSKEMSDMEDEGYKTMVCLETANALEDSKVVDVGENCVLGLVIG